MPFPSPGDLPNPGLTVSPASPALAGGFFTTVPPGKPFHNLAIINSAAMNAGVGVSFSIMISSGYMLSSGTAGSYGSFIPIFFFFKQNLHTVFHSGYYQFEFPPTVLEQEAEARRGGGTCQGHRGRE